MADQQIGQLTMSWLTKYIRKQIEEFPLQFLSVIQAEQAIVTKKLVVAKDVEFSQFKDWRFVGSQGNPAFEHSWVNFGSPNANASFQRLPDGFVALHGKIKSGTVGQSAFTLPPGFRPVAPIEFAVASNAAFGLVIVGSDGTVTPTSPASNVYVVLDQIRFKAA